MIKVLIADDYQMVCLGISHTLVDMPDIEVVGEGRNGLEILSLLKRGLPANVLLTDLNMQEMNGLALSQAMADKTRISTLFS